MSPGDEKFAFFKKLIIRSRLSARIILKKQSVDPIQDAIITENVLAVMGVSMPVITSFLCYATGFGWLDSVGEFSNGIVQLYLGYLICKDNTEILMGRGVLKPDFDKISNILKSRTEVSSISDLKTRWSNEVLSISATVKYDENTVAKNILKAMKQDIENITSDNKERAIISRLLLKYTAEFMKLEHSTISKMEADLQKLYPSAQFIDLQRCHTNIHDLHKGTIASTFKPQILTSSPQESKPSDK